VIFTEKLRNVSGIALAGCPEVERVCKGRKAFWLFCPFFMKAVGPIGSAATEREFPCRYKFFVGNWLRFDVWIYRLNIKEKT